jgi:gamma-glutamyltranspeptidase/glutathione hydrolase
MLRGLTPQEAVDAPRFCISAGSPDSLVAGETAGDINSAVYFENTFDFDVIQKLRGLLLFIKAKLKFIDLSWGCYRNGT